MIGSAVSPADQYRGYVARFRTMSISTADYDYVRELLRRRVAIVLDEGKEYLVEARLAPLVRETAFSDLAGLIRELRSKPFNGLHRQVVEAMANNETSFFRDVQPFEALRK